MRLPRRCTPRNDILVLFVQALLKHDSDEWASLAAYEALQKIDPEKTQ